MFRFYGMIAVLGVLLNVATATILPGQQARPGGSGNRNATSTVGLAGYCPVSIVRMHKWVKGDPSLRSTYDGKTYHFATPQAKEAFDQDPARYVPAFGGNCVVAYAKHKQIVPGSVRYGAFYKGRLYLLCSQETQREFLAHPAKYAAVEVGLGGQCPVCLAHGTAVVGKPEISAYFQGIRYQFPSDAMRAEFMKNPAKYLAAAKKNAAGVAGSGTKTSRPRGSGTR